MANKCHIYTKRIVAAGLLTVATSSIHAQQSGHFGDPFTWDVKVHDVSLNYSFGRVTLVQGVLTRATATMTTNPAVAEVPPAPNARVGQFFRSVRRGDFPIQFGRYNRTGFSGYLEAEARVCYVYTAHGVNKLDHATRFIVAASFEP